MGDIITQHLTIWIVLGGNTFVFGFELRTLGQTYLISGYLTITASAATMMNVRTSSSTTTQYQLMANTTHRYALYTSSSSTSVMFHEYNTDGTPILNTGSMPQITQPDDDTVAFEAIFIPSSGLSFELFAFNGWSQTLSNILSDTIVGNINPITHFNDVGMGNVHMVDQDQIAIGEDGSVVLLERAHTSTSGVRGERTTTLPSVSVDSGTVSVGGQQIPPISTSDGTVSVGGQEIPPIVLSSGSVMICSVTVPTTTNGFFEYIETNTIGTTTFTASSALQALLPLTNVYYAYRPNDFVGSYTYGTHPILSVSGIRSTDGILFSAPASDSV